jgi:hypothetical protein
MRITSKGSDYIVINEESINDKDLQAIPRVHLIKLDFEKPTETKVRMVLNLFPKTNRYVIENNIKQYNNILKYTNKKYYVENTIGANVITFFKKNNKVIVNFNNFTDIEREFLLDGSTFSDVLKNTEVVIIDQDGYEKFRYVLENWSGNVIIDNGKIL